MQLRNLIFRPHFRSQHTSSLCRLFLSAEIICRDDVKQHRNKNIKDLFSVLSNLCQQEMICSLSTSLAGRDLTEQQRKKEQQQQKTYK
jgi:hypothetical protein